MARLRFEPLVFHNVLGTLSPAFRIAEGDAVVGDARPLDSAPQHASTALIAWLGRNYGLDALVACRLPRRLPASQREPGFPSPCLRGVG